jgi:hypothetical protein
MAIVVVPTSILTKIRQLIYDFIWSGGRKEHGLHLCNWSHLAKLKRLGAWGLKNPFLFKLGTCC